MELSRYRPQAKLVTSATRVEKPRFPACDAHNHLGETFGGGWDRRPLSELLDLLDEAGIVCLVDLDGGWGEHLLHAHLDHFKQPAPERFQVFGGIDWTQWPEKGNAFPDWAAARLRAQQARGAQGLKIWKNLGLQTLGDSVYAYTLSVLNHLASKGLTPEMVQVWNETNGGMLFPHGKVENDDWTSFGALLNAGIAAIREFSASSEIKPLVILHVAQFQHAEWWIDRVVHAGKVTDFDILGVSHYSKWSTMNHFSCELHE